VSITIKTRINIRICIQHLIFGKDCNVDYSEQLTKSHWNW